MKPNIVSMSSPSIRRRVSLIILFVAVLLTQTATAEIIMRYDSAQGRQDLLLIGFSEITMHSMSVSGNSNKSLAEEAFERGNPWLKKDFASNYRASIFANGNLGSLFINGTTIIDSRIDDEYRTNDPSVFRLRMSVESTEPLWDSWRFTGKGLYDPQRRWEMANLDTRLLTEPQQESRLELLARLESDKYGYIEGGSLRPSFANTRFSLNQRSLFGVFADLENGPVGVEGVAGKLEGKKFREGDVVGIRADGTSGPYDLTNAPVTRGSEEIKIEVRDRFDETTVLSTRILKSEIDYDIDYLRGRILLNEPVSSETTASDPVYIVITYDYQRTADDDLYGGRARVLPNENSRAGVAYLHRNKDVNAFGDGVDEPDDLYAADMSFESEKYGNGYVEVAGSEAEDTGDDNTALRLGWNGKIIDRLSAKADFQKIDDDFRSFTNSDLNPNKNQQRIDVSGTFDLTDDQNVSAGYRNLQTIDSGGTFNPYAGQREEQVIGLGYKNHLSKSLNLGLRLEQRDVENTDDPTDEKYQRQRAILDLDGFQKDFAFLGEFGYGLHYEYFTFRDNRSGVSDSSNTNTNQIALSLSSRPVESSKIELIQKLRLRRGTVSNEPDDREDATFVRFHTRPHQNFSSLSTAEYKRFTRSDTSTGSWISDPHQVIWAATTAMEYLPLRKIKVLGKAGRQQTEIYKVDSTARNTNDFLLGQLTYFFTHHLYFDGTSEYSRRIRRTVGTTSRGSVWDLGLKVNWNQDRFNQITAGMIRRRQTDENTDKYSTSYILLLSGSMSITQNFFARASVKSLLLRETLEDEKNFIQAEVGYEGANWFRVSIGYEHIEAKSEDFPANDYRGHGPFIRLVGKI
ncbi:MAG: hypothetical protein GY841_17345 [FCB group bacterium]|nr:hypothetical protein [FCB group bacterium]